MSYDSAWAVARRSMTEEQFKALWEQFQARTSSSPETSPKSGPPKLRQMDFAEIGLEDFLRTCDMETLKRSFPVLFHYGRKPAADIYRERLGLQGEAAWLAHVRSKVGMLRVTAGRSSS